MDSKLFLAKFGHIASAPEGVKRLREMVLCLAFQGRLTEHGPEDAAVLLASLEEQRASSSKESRGFRKRTSATARTLQQSFAIPDHWRWLTLSEVGHDWGQKTPRTDFTYIDVSSIDNQRGTIRDQHSVLTADQAPSRARKIVRTNTVIYSTVRPYLLNIALIDREFEHEPIASTAFAIIHPWKGILPKYIYYYLRCPYFVTYVQSVQIGMAYPAISDKKFFAGLIPIPPTSEQERIIAKISELMALCDKLEAQQQECEALRKLTRTTLLEALVNAQSSVALNRAWQRLEKELPILLREKDSTLEFAIAIKSLALHGFLTERGLGHAEELLAHAYAEQLKLIDEGRIPKVKGLLPVASVPYKLPANWRWARLHQVAEVVDPNPSHRMPKYMFDGVPFISTENFTADDQIDFTIGRKVSKEDLAAHIKRYEIRDGSFAFSRIGTIGKTCHLPKQRTYCISYALVVISPLTKEIDERYLRLAVSAEATLKQAQEGVKGIGVPDLGMAKIRNFLLPIPPLEEQVRIVSRVYRLIAFCSRLEAYLSTAKPLASALAIASTSSIIGVRIEDKEKMKAPKTELISTLRIGVSPTNGNHAPLATILIRNNGELSAKALWNTSGLEIDAFYQQLRTEMAKGWIVQPEVAYMKEVEAS
jgi:Restriction endonuclease S subunits